MREWSITWGGKTWTAEDLTVEHASIVLILNSSDDWSAFEPSSPLKLLYLLAAFVTVDKGADVGEVIAQLHKEKLSRIIGAVSFTGG